MATAARKIEGTGIIFPGLLLIGVGAWLLTSTHGEPGLHFWSWFILGIGIIYFIVAMIVWVKR